MGPSNGFQKFQRRFLENGQILIKFQQFMKTAGLNKTVRVVSSEEKKMCLLRAQTQGVNFLENGLIYTEKTLIIYRGNGPK
jgi:hypothetical protein